MDFVMRVVLWALGFALILPSLMVHEVAHGVVALWCGDRTAKRAGRLTLNPMRHIDMVGTIVVPVVLIFLGAPAFGWAKPVPVNLGATRKPRQALWMVALAGPLANFLLAVVAALESHLCWMWGWTGCGNFLFQYGVVANLYLMIFNLIPVPPLDGSRIVSAVLPRNLAWQYNQLGQYGILILLLLFHFLPGFQRMLSEFVYRLAFLFL